MIELSDRCFFAREGGGGGDLLILCSPLKLSLTTSTVDFGVGMDVVMMNDFEQRHLSNKSRSHSPFGHIGSPTTPLNFEQLFLQGQLPLSSELSQHEQAMLQAQLLNGMRTSGEYLSVYRGTLILK